MYFMSTATGNKFIGYFRLQPLQAGQGSNMSVSLALKKVCYAMKAAFVPLERTINELC